MNPLQQPPQLSDKVPIEAQALMMQPEAVNMLRGINGYELLSLFYFQMPFMLKNSDRTVLEKSGMKLFTLLGGAFSLGVIANVQVKRLYMNFLKWPILARIPLRPSIMAIPFALFSQPLTQRSDEIIDTIDKVTIKKNLLLKNRDLEEYFDV